MGGDRPSIVFTRRPIRQLLALGVSALAVPAVVVLPLLVFVVAPVGWVFGGFGTAWRIVAVLAALLLVAGLVLMVLAVRAQLGEVHTIELLPTRVVFHRIRGTDGIAVSDLRQVTVIETVKLGASTGCEVVFDTADGRQRRCPAVMGDRLAKPAVEVAAWFAGHLRPVGVEVIDRTEVERARLTIENWYPAGRVAQLWGIEAAQVPATAAHLGVRSGHFTPRVGAMHGTNRTVVVYDPDDVHLVDPRAATEECA